MPDGGVLKLQEHHTCSVPHSHSPPLAYARSHDNDDGDDDKGLPVPTCTTPFPLPFSPQSRLTPLRAAGLLGTSSFSTGNPLFRPRMVPVLDMAVCPCGNRWAGGERDDENVLCVGERWWKKRGGGGREGRPCLEHDAPPSTHSFYWPPPHTKCASFSSVSAWWSHSPRRPC